jgi:hypothetical protein
LGDAEHDELLKDATGNSFSLREKARMRGYTNKPLSDFVPSTQPFYALQGAPGVPKERA